MKKAVKSKKEPKKKAAKATESKKTSKPKSAKKKNSLTDEEEDFDIENEDNLKLEDFNSDPLDDDEDEEFFDENY